jgi:Trp operon repressor
MEHLSSGMEQQHEQVQWRRDKVQELCSKGYSQREISQVLQVGLATVNRYILSKKSSQSQHQKIH